MVDRAVLESGVKGVYVLVQQGKGEEAESNKKQQLWESGTAITVEFVWESIPQNGTPFNPLSIHLPHSFIATDPSICLLVKDPASKAKEEIEALGIQSVKEVLGIRELKKEHARYEDKRILCESHDLFLADDRIVPMLPKTLGKYFLCKKKLPIVIKYSATTLKDKIEKAKHTALFYYGSGTLSSIRVGTTEFSESQILDNVIAVVDKVMEKFGNKVSSIQIKGSTTMAIPLYVKAAEDVKATKETTVLQDVPIKEPPKAITMSPTKSAQKPKAVKANETVKTPVKAQSTPPKKEAAKPAQNTAKETPKRSPAAKPQLAADANKKQKRFNKS